MKAIVRITPEMNPSTYEDVEVNVDLHAPNPLVYALDAAFFVSNIEVEDKPDFSAEVIHWMPEEIEGYDLTNFFIQWQDEDIYIRIRHLGYSPTPGRVHEIHNYLVDNFDANIGINWPVIDDAVEEAYNES
jgi:hypothetical protein